MAVLLGAKPPIPTAQFVIGESKTFTAPMTGTIKVIITGGFSNLFKNSIQTKASHNQDITIKGLIKISKLIK